MKKIIAIAISTIMMGSVWAADNSIYIDQSGSNSTISITQDGYGNVVKGINSGNTTPATIYGINNQVTVNQVGMSNTLSLGVQTTTGGTTTLPDGSTVSVPTIKYSVTGNNATAVIDSNNDGAGASRGTYISIDQTGNSANANINVRGNNNAITAVTSGGDNNSVVAKINGNNNVDGIKLTGDSNATNIAQGTALQASNGNSIGIKANGASNTFGITQTGGTAGNSVTIGGYAGDTLTGSSNSVTVTQGGGNDNSLVLGLTGSSNTVGVTQTATAGNNVANLKVNGSSSNITISQTNR